MNEGGAEQPGLVAVPAVNGALAVVAVALPPPAEVGERTRKRVVRVRRGTSSVPDRVQSALSDASSLTPLLSSLRPLSQPKRTSEVAT